MAKPSSETWAEYRARNRDRITRHEKARWRNNPAYSLWRGARDRARRADIDFNIEIEDIEIPTKCPILDIPLKINEGRPGRDSPSLDRIDNKFGYVKGNISVISFKANSLKTNMSKETIENLYRYVSKT